MKLAAADFASLLLAVGLLLGAAHAVGHLFTLMRQPRVIGEIMGGLLLGPTVFGVLAPELQAAVFPTEGPVASVLGWNYQIGLLLLMFASGAEMRSVFRRDESRVVGLVTVVGVVLPFAAGVLLFQVLGDASHGHHLIHLPASVRSRGPLRSPAVPVRAPPARPPACARPGSWAPPRADRLMLA